MYFNDPVSGASSEKHSTAGGTWQDYIFADGQRVSVRTQTTSPAAITFQYNSSSAAKPCRREAAR